jgi:hypothetical protein
MKININSFVKVRLTDVGKRIHREAWDSLFMPQHVTYRAPEEDEEGYSKWQLWSLMNVYGRHIGLGLDLPFESEIEILT